MQKCWFDYESIFNFIQGLHSDKQFWSYILSCLPNLCLLLNTLTFIESGNFQNIMKIFVNIFLIICFFWASIFRNMWSTLFLFTSRLWLKTIHELKIESYKLLKRSRKRSKERCAREANWEESTLGQMGPGGEEGAK